MRRRGKRPTGKARVEVRDAAGDSKNPRPPLSKFMTMGKLLLSALPNGQHPPTCWGCREGRGSSWAPSALRERVLRLHVRPGECL